MAADSTDEIGSPRWRTTNALIELAEINIDGQRVDAAIKGETDLFLDLRFGLGGIEINGQEIDVGFRVAELYLELDGVEITPGSRFGDHRVDPVVSQNLKETSKASISKNTNTKGGMSTDLKSLSMNSSHDRATSIVREDVVAQESSKREYRISARPNNLWLLEGPDGGALVDTYFAGDLLCKIRPIDKSNRHGAKIVLIARKRHIMHSCPEKKAGLLSKLYSGNTNLDRVFGVLLAKSIGNSEKYGKYQDYIEISSINNHEL
jgi:hypothetical protein